MSGHCHRPHGKGVKRWGTAMVILCFSFNLFSGLLVRTALSSEKRPHQSKIRQSRAKQQMPPAPAAPGEAFVDEVKAYVGIPYRWGGASKKGMDCSGFVRHVYSKAFSLDLPHSSYLQYAHPTMKKIPAEDLRTGDLIFFSQKGKRVNHVGIYLEDGRFIHAGRKSGVTISSLDSRYWKLRMVCAKRPASLRGYEAVDRSISLSGEAAGETERRQAFSGSAEKGWRMASVIEGLGPLSHWQDLAEKGLAEGLSHTFGLQISQSFGGASWRMSLLQENHLRSFPKGYDPLLTSIPLNPWAERQYIMDGHLQGIKMASDFYPVDWLQITPSFSYAGYGRDPEKSPSWAPGLGLAVQIRPLPARWSLAADLQYWEEEDGFAGGVGGIDHWKGGNVSLMFGYDFSKDVRLSIVGQHRMGNLFSPPDRRPSSYNQQEQNDLFFGLDWAF